MQLNDTVTRLRAPLTSAGYGNSERDWANATSQDFRIRWSFKSWTEVVGDDERTVTGGSIFGGPDLDLLATDRVVYQGETYEIAGDVVPSMDGRGVLHHYRARTRRIALSGT